MQSRTKPDIHECLRMIGELNAAQKQASNLLRYHDQCNAYRINAAAETIVEIAERAKGLIESLAPKDYAD